MMKTKAAMANYKRRVGEWTVDLPAIKKVNIPIVHDKFHMNWIEQEYHDTFIDRAEWPAAKETEYQKFMRILSDPDFPMLVLVQRDKSETDKSCDGYVGIFSIKDLDTSDGTVFFKLDQRISA